MEDVFSVAYQHTKEGQDLEYAYFGIFDGHGGKHAAIFAKEHLMDNIVSNPYFWSDIDEDVLKAIKEGFISTHMAMYKVLDTWPKTMSGLPSTSGTTASIAFIRRGKIFTGHVGDSGIVLGYQDPDSGVWYARPLTQDHKPESAMEIGRIQESGGKVVWKAGVPRVVWNRPKIGHRGPVLRSTHIDEIPFLAVARSLGDLWSFNSASNQFVVSPEPDVNTMTIDVSRHRCLILGTDGLWNMIPPQRAVEVVQVIDRQNKMHPSSDQPMPWVNPSKRLVNTALDYWLMNKLRADNCTAVTALLDPPGPPLSGLLAWQKLEGQVRPNPSTLATTASAAGHDAVAEVEDTNADSRPSCSSSMTDFSELSALLSEAVPVPVTGYEPPQRRTPTPPKSIMVHRDERLELDPGRAEDLGDPAHRVLRNRTLGVSGLDNKCPKKGAALLGGSLRKKVVTVEVALTQQLRKRPMTRSSHDNNSTEDRNASDTENQIKKSRRSLPVSASHRILRSSATMSSLVRTLRSQDSNLHAQSHYRKKRSRSFTPVKRRKQ